MEDNHATILRREDQNEDLEKRLAETTEQLVSVQEKLKFEVHHTENLDTQL